MSDQDHWGPRSAHGGSVRSRLLRPLLWTWLIGLLLSTLGASWLARRSANEAFDRGLQDQVAALAAKVNWSDRGPLLDLSRQVMELLSWDGADRNGYVMVDVDGNPLAGDGTVPLPPVALRRSAFSQPRLFDAVLADEPVRGVVFSVTSPMIDRSVSLVIVETTRQRGELMRQLQLSIVLPALALGLATFVLLGWGIARGLQPLRDVAAEVAQRDAQDWHPLPLDRVPMEAVPLIARINRLLAEMEQSSQLQRRFVADAAHQLRTPVAGIRILVQTLQQDLHAVNLSDDTGSPQARQPLLDELTRATDHLSRLIGQLLSLARSETALSAAHPPAPTDLVRVAREALEPLMLRGLRDGRAMALDAPAEAVWARAHPLWLGEVLVNLVDNALRYGGEQVTVRVQADPGGGACIEVEDDGPGVTQDQLPRLFEPFWRGDRADRRNDEGTGLGLTIAREIVLRQGGQIQVESRPRFPGLRFRIHLPA